MARLRNHEQFGQSVGCFTLSPYVKDEGPTFTAHIFDTGEIENGSKVLAYELWQRDVKGERTLLLEGKDFSHEDPRSKDAFLALTNKLVDLVECDTEDKKIQVFRDEHAQAALQVAKERFSPKAPKRQRKPRADAPEVPESPVVEAAAEDVEVTEDAELEVTQLDVSELEEVSEEEIPAVLAAEDDDSEAAPVLDNDDDSYEDSLHV